MPISAKAKMDIKIYFCLMTLCLENTHFGYKTNFSLIIIPNL